MKDRSHKFTGTNVLGVSPEKERERINVGNRG